MLQVYRYANFHTHTAIHNNVIVISINQLNNHITQLQYLHGPNSYNLKF